MKGDLEAAIIPTPQRAELKDTVFPAGKVAVILPKGYEAPDTLVRELSQVLGAELVATREAATVIHVGRAAKGTPARPDPRLAGGEDGYILQFAFHNRRFWMLSNTTVYKSVSLGDDWSPEVMAYGYLRCLSFTESHPYIHGWAAGNNGILLHYTFDTTPVLDNEYTPIPERFELSQNYPNPFNPETTIRYTLPSNSHVVIRIFNLLGQPVRNVESRSYSAGMHRYRWDGRDDDRNAVESGIYLLTIETKFGTEVRKMTLLK